MGYISNKCMIIIFSITKLHSPFSHSKHFRASVSFLMFYVTMGHSHIYDSNFGPKIQKKKKNLLSIVKNDSLFPFW